MSKSESSKFLVQFKHQIKTAAKRFKVPPYSVTLGQFRAIDTEKISEWQLRKLGGFMELRECEFPTPESVVSTVFPRTAKKKKNAYRPPPLTNFIVHNMPVRELFKAARLPHDGVFRMVVQPDTHVPYHDHAAVEAFCSFVKWYKPHGLINLGDFLENESVSHWPTATSKPRRLVPEIKTGRMLLRKIGDAAGPQCIFKRFIIGNHEDWLDQMLVNKIPEVYDGIEELGIGLRIQDLLELKDLGYRVIPMNEILQVGNLCYIHGYYTQTHHAKKHLEVFGTNLMYGHLHDSQEYSAVSIKGIHQATSIGCLRQLNADFLKGKPNNWSHNFGIVEYRIDGNYTKVVPTIVDGEFSYAGKIFGK